jgi:hypothetical protein
MIGIVMPKRVGEKVDEPKIQVFEPGSEEEQVMNSVLALAKHTHEDHGAEARAYIFGAGRSLTIASFIHFGDYNDPRVKGRVAEWLRAQAKAAQAHFIAIVSDAFVTSFDDFPAIRAEGLDYKKWDTWPLEARRRHPRSRREALVLIIQTRIGNKTVEQFYRRDNDRIVWEECTVSDDDSGFGLFWGLLPKAS